MCMTAETATLVSHLPVVWEVGSKSPVRICRNKGIQKDPEEPPTVSKSQIPPNAVLHDNTKTTALALLLFLGLLVPHLLRWLLLLSILHLLLPPMMLRSRVPSSSSSIIRRLTHRIRRLVHGLAILRVLRLMLALVIVPRHLLRMMLHALQTHVDASLILLGMVLQPQLATDLLDARLDLLNVVLAVVALAHDDVEVRLARGLRVPDALLEDFFCLLYELAMQINGVAGNLADSIVLAEDEFGGLFVVVVCRCLMLLGLLAEVVCAGTVALFVGMSCFCGEVLVLALFFARQIAESVIFALRIRSRSVVEGLWDALASEEQHRRLYQP